MSQCDKWHVELIPAEAVFPGERFECNPVPRPVCAFVAVTTPNDGLATGVGDLLRVCVRPHQQWRG